MEKVLIFMLIAVSFMIAPAFAIDKRRERQGR